MSKADRRRAAPDSNRRVVGFPSSRRAGDAIGHLTAAVANSSVRGVMLVLVDHVGRVDTRVFGDVLTRELCWAGALLQDHALHGGDE